MIMIAPSFSIIDLADARAASDLVCVSPVTNSTFLPRIPFLQRFRDEGVQHAAVAFAIQVLDSQFLCAKLIKTFFSVGACLRHVEADCNGAAGGGVGKAGVAGRP